jgi:predicted transcriptional regulator
MAERGMDVLPVSDRDRLLVGTITEHDVVRGVAEGRGPDNRVADVMTDEVNYCYDDDEILDVLRSMAVLELRRLLVLDRARRFVGTFAISDLAAALQANAMDATLEGVSGPH